MNGEETKKTQFCEHFANPIRGGGSCFLKPPIIKILTDFVFKVKISLEQDGGDI